VEDLGASFSPAARITGAADLGPTLSGSDQMVWLGGFVVVVVVVVYAL
jgi:hypothetical protein